MIRFIKDMFEKLLNPHTLRLKCSDCGKNGRPMGIEGTSVGCGNCGSGWDGSILKDKGI